MTGSGRAPVATGTERAGPDAGVTLAAGADGALVVAATVGAAIFGAAATGLGAAVLAAPARATVAAAFFVVRLGVEDSPAAVARFSADVSAAADDRFLGVLGVRVSLFDMGFPVSCMLWRGMFACETLHILPHLRPI